MNLFFFLWSVLILITFLAARQDAQTQTISNTLLFTGMLFALFLHGIFQGAMSTLSLMASALAWLFIGGVLWRMNGLGGGDVKLFAMIAVFTGFYGAFLIALLSICVQFLWSLWRFSGGDMRLNRPFAPSILIGTLALLVFQLVFLVKNFSPLLT